MDDFLTQGQAALKAGDRARARQLLQSAAQQNPQNETAWLWLAGAVDSDFERAMYLEKALAINPGNAGARKALDRMRPAVPAVPPAPAVIPHAPPFTERAPIQSIPFPAQSIPFPAQSVQVKSCPSCRKDVPVDALICPYCGKHFFEEQPLKAKPASKVRAGSFFLIAAGIGLILGAILPWGTVTSVFGRISVYGYEGDGLITGGAGAFILLAGFARLKTRGIIVGILAILISALAFYVAGQKFISLTNIETNEYVSLDIGVGLYLTFFSAFIGSIGGLVKLLGQ